MIEFSELQNQQFSILGAECKLIGEFQLTGIVKLAAHMEGQLTMGPQGQLTIEREGRFQGQIHCQDIEVFGEFEGNLYSTGRVILQSSARVQGRIETQNLIIYPGAKVNIDGHTLQADALKK